MSTWKETTPYWQFRRSAPRKGAIRHRENRKLIIHQGHRRNLSTIPIPDPEARPTMPERSPETTATYVRFLAILDRAAIPITGLIALGLIAFGAWLIFAPAAPPGIPRPSGGYPVRLLDASWPGATTRDGRRARYVADAPDDGTPEPPLHRHDHATEGRPR